MHSRYIELSVSSACSAGSNIRDLTYAVPSNWNVCPLILYPSKNGRSCSSEILSNFLRKVKSQAGKPTQYASIIIAITLLLVICMFFNCFANYIQLLSFNQPVISITSANTVDSFLLCKFTLTPTAEYCAFPQSSHHNCLSNNNQFQHCLFSLFTHFSKMQESFKK